ncbi:HVA1 family protein [Streptomyces sp. NPDC127039]
MAKNRDDRERLKKGDPQYQVRSDRSGRSVVHKPSALKKK